MSRDLTAFVDSDGTGYLVSAANENYDLHIYRLTADYTGVAGLVANPWPGGHREAPALFERNGVYFMLTSGATGWSPNQQQYATAPSPSGLWTAMTNVGDSTAYGSQTGGSAPALAGIRVTPAAHARQILLVGDSTVCDQPGEPCSGWGQQLPRYLRRGLSVANYADSGESTVSYLGNPQLWGTVQPLIRPGDLVLIQLAHNDKTTDEATYRANLETLVAGVREKGGEPVLVTPIVRRWFNSDGTLNNNTALLVNGLGVDHPAVIRSVAAAEGVPLVDLTARTKALVESLGVEGSKAIYLYNEKKDNTHTSVHGATVYAGLVRDELVARHLVPERLVRVG
ncbi:GDSL-type esterase/lipase family protein [Streptomyces sp. NPDC000987]|uniref:GDSL-type esterase/lipase family protein n=1 Tax=Streptomyces sp. NPDC000987 TaxID=3154374 RepID=UPI00332918FD